MFLKVLVRRVVIIFCCMLRLLAADPAGATRLISLDELKQLALARYSLLSIRHQQGLVIDEKISSLDRRRYPDVGFVLGANSIFDESKQTSDGVGFSYIRYRILDGGFLKKSQLLLESKRQLQGAEIALVARELLYIIEKSYFQLSILTETLNELQTLQRRNVSLEKTLRRMVLAGSANDLIISGFAITSDKLKLDVAVVQAAINDAELLLSNYIAKNDVARLQLQLPKIEDALSRPEGRADDALMLGLRDRASEARAAAQAATSVWMPELTIEGRYGILPLGEREMVRRTEGAILLSAEWSLASGLQRRDEAAIAKMEQEVLEAELDFVKKTRSDNHVALKAKIRRHTNNIENFVQHYKDVSNYSLRLEKAAEMGAVPIFEAKSTIEQLVNLIGEISEEKMVVWGLVAELNAQFE